LCLLRVRLALVFHLIGRDPLSQFTRADVAFEFRERLAESLS
jgi:hypothetical protein